MGGRTKMRKALVGVILAGAVLVIVSCAGPIQQTTPSIPPSTPANHAPIVIPVPTSLPGGPEFTPPSGRGNVYSVQIDLVPSKLVYISGEQVQMELIMANASQGEVEPVIVSPLPPAISLVKSGTSSSRTLPSGIVVPDLEPGGSASVKTFPAGTEERKLAVGERVTYNLTWDQKDEDGKQVSPGWYYYEYRYDFRKDSSGEGVGSGGRDRAFLIQYPQGAMQKSIEVNQSRTLTGVPLLTMEGETKLVDVVITLERVELNEMGVTFYAEMTSPDNPVSGYSNPEWAGHIPMSAQYIVDGAVIEARAPNSKFLDSGIQFRWGASPDDDNYLDPVPADAKELTFVIPEIEPDWEGPWEFKILLE
jgi:hypothetical protein